VSNSRIAIIAGAVFLSAALAVSSFSVQKTSAPTPKQILTWDCGTAVYKPESITITCADGGIYVKKIQWSNWGKEGAAGYGVLSENLCKPSCAEGQQVTASVNLRLSDLTELKGKYYLQTLDIGTLVGKNSTFDLRAMSGNFNGGFEWD
jgi:hypothetical protein